MDIRLARLAARIAADEELADGVRCDFKECLDELGSIQELPPVGGKRPPRRKPPRPRLLRHTPEPRGETLKLIPLSSGGSTLRIDGGKDVALTPRLTRLVNLLRADSGRSDDDLLGWWPLEHVAAILGKKTARTVRCETVRHWIYKLRNAFEKADYDARLVQTNRQLGVRLALKRKDPTVVVEDDRL